MTRGLPQAPGSGIGWWWREGGGVRGSPSGRSEPLEDDLSDRVALLEALVRAFEVGGVDRPEVFGQRGLEDAAIDEVGGLVQQMVLRDHVRRVEHGPREHQLPRDRDAL